MKRGFLIFSVLSVLFFTACLLLTAAEIRSRNDAERKQTAASVGQAQPQVSLEKRRKASDLLGISVKNQQGDDLGEIDDFVVDLRGGRVAYCVLASGGFLGIGHRLLALPTSAFTLPAEAKVLILDADKESLGAAPSFDAHNWPDMADAKWRKKVDRYAEQHFPKNKITIYEAAGSERTETNGASQKMKVPIEDGERKAHSDGLEKTIREPSGTGISAGDQWKFMRASEILGAGVKNSHDERVGEIRDLVVDFSSSEIAYAVLASGGFLGIGEKFFAVPVGSLIPAAGEKMFILNVSKETLKTSSGFDRNNWPAAPDQAFTTQIYRYHGQDTRTNVNPPQISEPAGSQKKNNLTADDQSNEKEDIDLTRQLRIAIMNDSALSFAAQNIKIITVHGNITLRGTVNSAEEKQNIVARTRRMVGPGSLSDQLEVKGE